MINFFYFKIANLSIKSSPVNSPSKINLQIHPELKKNFGYPIPKHFDNLVHLFATLENVFGYSIF